MFSLFKRNPRNTRKFLKQENEQLKTDYQKEREKCYQAKKQIKAQLEQIKELQEQLTLACKEVKWRQELHIADLETQCNYLGKIMHFQEKLEKSEKLNEQLLGEFPDDLQNLLNTDNQ